MSTSWVHETLSYLWLSFFPLLSHLYPLFVFPPPSSLYLSPPSQGDDPLNSADDDEDSDGEGAHFDTEDNIVCQFEKVCCSQQASPR